MTDHSDIDHTGLTGVGGGAEFATATASVATGQTTTSTTYADLGTVGPSVTVTVGASGKVMLHMRCRLQNNTAGNFSAAGVVISGASTVAAQTIMLVDTANSAYLYEFGASKLISGLTPGSTTFKMQYLVEGGTGTFTNRELTIAPVL